MTMTSLRGISVKGWRKLSSWTLLGTLGCIAISVAFNFTYFSAVAPDALIEGVASAVVIPIILAGPLFFYLTLKLRELAVANHRLQELASTDALTACLNRGAFTTLVDGHLDRLPGMGGDRQGALLVIDADHFKSINDRYGHHCGDDALRAIADAIRSSVRKGDLIGRLGGEEFGVFLPDGAPEGASLVAERIRRAVGNAEFNPDGDPQRLSISVGGASFDRRVTFSDLFRIADEQLYSAKRSGRDRVELTFMPGMASSHLSIAVH